MTDKRIDDIYYRLSDIEEKTQDIHYLLIDIWNRETTKEMRNELFKITDAIEEIRLYLAGMEGEEE